MHTVLQVDNVEKYYGSKGNLTKALEEVSFRVDKGEFVGIMGASGSGKTTLLNCISTIDRVTGGHIFVNGRDITELKGNALNRFRREELGFIFQDFNLLDTMTAYENIALALSIQGKKSKEIAKRVNAIAGQLGIAEVLQKYPYQMSGGQKQRVASEFYVFKRSAFGDDSDGDARCFYGKLCFQNHFYQGWAYFHGASKRRGRKQAFFLQ